MASSHAKETTVFNNNQKNVLTSKKQIDFILYLVVKQKNFQKKLILVFMVPKFVLLINTPSMCMLGSCR